MFDFLKRFKKQPEISQANILVIEDANLDRVFIQRILEKKYSNILLAENGPKGLEIANKQKVDVIILDYVLDPGMNGLEVCRILKTNSNTKNIPVIFLTLVHDGTVMIECLEAGAVVYLTKPIAAKQLIDEIELTLSDARSGKVTTRNT